MLNPQTLNPFRHLQLGAISLATFPLLLELQATGSRFEGQGIPLPQLPTVSWVIPRASTIELRVLDVIDRVYDAGIRVQGSWANQIPGISPLDHPTSENAACSRNSDQNHIWGGLFISSPKP